MKKLIIIFAITILLLLSACSSKVNDFSIEMLPNDIEQVKVSHYLSGEVNEWAIEGNELENWKSWLSGLSARQKDFKEGNSRVMLKAEKATPSLSTTRSRAYRMS